MTLQECVTRLREQATTPPQRGEPRHPRWIERQQEQAAVTSAAWTRAAVSVTGGSRA